MQTGFTAYEHATAEGAATPLETPGDMVPANLKKIECGPMPNVMAALFNAAKFG